MTDDDFVCQACTDADTDWCGCYCETCYPHDITGGQP